MKLIPASEVSSGQLSEFFARIPDGEQAFLKEDVRDPATIAAWRRPGAARREAAIDQAGTIVGVVSVIPELGWSDHVGQVLLLVDPAYRGKGIGPTARVEHGGIGQIPAVATVQNDEHFLSRR